MSVERIAISLEPGIVKKLEERMRDRVYLNRSKAVSDLLREAFLNEEITKGRGARIGAISFVYNHEQHGVQERVTDVQHGFGANIIASMHIHLSHEECLEIVAAKGTAKKLRKISEAIASVRGVKGCRVLIVR